MKIHDNADSVALRLAALGLEYVPLLQVVSKAVTARNDSVETDPINTPGQFAYIYGTRAIRQYLLPKGWNIDRSENIEATVNPHTGTRLIYQNCDVCCSSSRAPRAISTKGAAACRMLDYHNGDLFPQLLAEAQSLASGNIWFLCVSVSGDDVRAELSCPGKLEGKQFSEFRERIYLSPDGFLGTRLERTVTAREEVTDNYDVIVTKKAF